MHDFILIKKAPTDESQMKMLSTTPAPPFFHISRTQGQEFISLKIAAVKFLLYLILALLLSSIEIIWPKVWHGAGHLSCFFWQVMEYRSSLRSCSSLSMCN